MNGPDPADPDFEAVLEHVRTVRAVDFSAYKASGLVRRISKRLTDLQLGTCGQYLEVLRADDDEVNRLLDTILINVTSFFRDTAVWRSLRDVTVPHLVERADGRPIKVWSAGCASGQEAYSLAMLLHEVLGAGGFHRQVKVYATDLDDGALAAARSARYAARALDAVPADLRDRHFVVEGDTALLSPALRHRVVFGRHDLTRDPPISRVDLLLCRNTLMYFTAASQTAILERLHFATHPSGLLVLGRSEALASRTDRFEPVDLQMRIYAPVGVARRTTPAPPRVSSVAGLADSGTVDSTAVGFDIALVAQLIVGPDGELLAVNRQARNLFGLDDRDTGRPLRDFEVSYRPLELRSQIDELRTQGRVAVVRGVEWEHGGRRQSFDVHLVPLPAPSGTDAGVSISYVDVTPRHLLLEELSGLRAALTSAHDQLQSTVEELETTNEELQSTNEELETTNEELQSTNEELETMNAELQSTNAELEALNDDLLARGQALDAANSALEAILTSLQSAVVVLSSDMVVEAWNPHAQELWGVRADEVLGEHVMNVDIGLPVEELRQSIRDVLNDADDVSDLTLRAVNRRGREVACRVRISPLRRDGRPAGAILLMDAEPVDRPVT